MCVRLVYLVAGGIAGTLSRYFISMAIARSAGTALPFGTLAVNLLGCFLAGIAAARFDAHSNSALFLLTGFCGAFTTFSAFTLETSGLLAGGFAWRAFAYVSFSIVAGLAAFGAGAALSGR